MGGSDPRVTTFSLSEQILKAYGVTDIELYGVVEKRSVYHRFLFGKSVLFVLLRHAVQSLVYDHIFRFGSNVCMNSVIACGTVAWCMARIIKGFDFCVILKLLVTMFSCFPSLMS